MTKKKTIEFFYGRECPYCVAIIPVVKKLEAEDGVEIIKREVWHNAENNQRMRSLGNLYVKYCGGNFIVPSFYDADGDSLIGNPGSYEHLKEWVFGEVVEI